MADYMGFPTPREHVLTCGNTTIGVIPEICLITHFQVGPWQVLYRPMLTGNIKRWGLPLMIPNFSRLNNGTFQEKGTRLPIHGFGRILPWTTVEQDSTHLMIQLSSNENTFNDYPYEFTFTVNVSVEDGTLTYTVAEQYMSLDQSAREFSYPHRRSIVSGGSAECRVTDLIQPLIYLFPE